MIRAFNPRVAPSLGVLALVFAAFGAGPLSAGVVFEIATKDHSAGSTSTMEAAVEGKNLKMQISADTKGQEGEMIYRGDRREMVVVDHGQKTYMVLDEAMIQKIGAAASSAMKQMEEALKNVPEDQRAMVEEMLKKRMGSAGVESKGPAAEVRKTSEKATKNGYPCVKYSVYEGERKVRDLWVTDWKNIDGATEAREAFEDMADFFQRLIDSLPKGGGMFSGAGAGGNMLTEMKELNGFPVEGSEFAQDGSLASGFALKSSKRQDLDPAAFEPPAGYKVQSMPAGF